MAVAGWTSTRFHPVALALAALAGSMFLAGCGAPDTGTRRIVVTGSSTVAPLVAEIGRRFEERHPHVRVDVQTGGSSRGIGDARSGAADIGMSSRALAADERDLTAFPVGTDGVVMIVHGDNSVRRLTREQVRGIYRGQIRDWVELGGTAGTIVVTHKAAGRGTLEVFLKHIGLKDVEVRADVIVGDNQQGVKTVAGNAQAIGYVSIGAVDAEIAAGANIHRVALSDGDGWIARPLLLVTGSEPTDDVLRFIEFARSPEVHDLIKAQYFVPVER